MSRYALVDHSVSPPRVEVPRRYNAAVDFVDRHLAEGRGERVAFVDDAGATSYAALAAAVDRAAAAFAALDVRMEERVVLILHDSAMMPAVFYGAIKRGAVPVPVNTRFTADDYDFILRDSRARTLVVSASLYDTVAPALRGQPFLTRVIIDGEPRDGHSSLRALLDAATPGAPAADTTADDVCFWLYTSGSTGQPKAAMHVHADLVYSAELAPVGVFGLRADDVVFSAAKLFFAYGLSNAMTFPLRVGARAVLMAERPTAASVIRTLRAHQPTVFCAVPTLYAAMLADGNLPRAGEHRLRVCISAGEALPPEVGRRFREHTGVDILDGIGSTELLHIFMCNRPGQIKYGTSGRPVPGYEVKVVDDRGAPAAPGELGDLWVSGPSSAIGYWNRRALSRETFVGGWTRTGDRYLVDDEGYYVYQGRADDMFKVGGNYVSPFEVEAALVSHEAVLECAVVGHPDEHQLLKPKAFVVLHEAARASRELGATLQAHVKAKLAVYKYPRWIEFVSELPKTATGKIQRFRLRQ